MGYMNTAIATANAIKSNLKDIKDAANTKGADIRDNDALNVWDSKILAIPSAFAPKFFADNNGQVAWFQMGDVLDVPVKDASGGNLNTTFALSNNLTLADYASVFSNFRVIKFPAYFNSVDLSFFGAKAVNSNVEELKCDAILIPQMNFANNVWKLRKLDLPNFTGSLTGDFYNTAFTNYGGDAESIVINIPKATGFQFTRMGHSGKNLNMTINAPNVETLGANVVSITEDGYCYLVGTFVFPKVTKAVIMETCRTAHNEFRLPALRYFGSMSAFATASGEGGKTKLCIGPNFTGGDPTAYWTSIATNMAARVNDGSLEIHIPAGDSTTKTTLDAKSITYTQDYDYQADL